jgi:type I restriction enzyme, S subunit
MWKTVKLGDVCDLQNGFAFKSSDYVDNSNTLNIRMSNIRPNGKFDELHNIKYLPDDYATKYADYKLIEGDLIIAMTDMAGDPKILGLPTIVKNLDERTFLLNQRVGKLHNFSDEIYVPYLCYFLSTLKNFYKNKGAGGLQINISKKDILSAKIPLPPLEQQQHIVAKLDAAFAEIDTAIEAVEDKDAELEKLKASLLSALMSDDAVMWKTARLGDAIEIARGGSPRPIKSFITTEDDGVNWIKIGDTKEGGRYIHTTKEKIKPSGVSRSRYVKENDFILSNSMSFGRPYILRTSGCIHDGWLVLSEYQELFSADYLYYLLSSSLVQNQFERLARGSTVRNLNIKLVSQITVPVPPLAEQQRIVAKLDAAYSKLEMAKEMVGRSKTNYQALKSAILAQELQSEAA